jgi:hypothetical protein
VVVHENNRKCGEPVVVHKKKKNQGIENMEVNSGSSAQKETNSGVAKQWNQMISPCS